MAKPFVVDVRLPAQQVWTATFERGVVSTMLAKDATLPPIKSPANLLTLRASNAQYGVVWQPMRIDMVPMGTPVIFRLIPWWIVLATPAVPTLLLWIPWVRRDRRKTCGACGYSRLGLPPGAACPECGNSVERSQA